MSIAIKVKELLKMLCAYRERNDLNNDEEALKVKVTSIILQV